MSKRQSLWKHLVSRGFGGDYMTHMERMSRLINDAYERFKGFAESSGVPDLGMGVFTAGEGGFSYAAFAWPKGELVKVKSATNVYGLVDGWDVFRTGDESHFDVILSTANGPLNLVPMISRRPTYHRRSWSWRLRSLMPCARC